MTNSNDSPTPVLSSQSNQQQSGSRIRLNNRDRLPTHVKIAADSQCATGDALELFGAELRDDRPPLADSGRADPQRPRDIRGTLKVINNVLLEHELSLTVVHSGMQPRSKTTVLTLVDMEKFVSLKDRLLDAVQEASVSASELARACDVSPAAVSKWLDGRTKKLSADNYASAARALGVREEWLRTGKLPRERQHASEERDLDRVLKLIEELRGPVTALAAALAKLASASAPSKKAKLS